MSLAQLVTLLYSGYTIEQWVYKDCESVRTTATVKDEGISVLYMYIAEVAVDHECVRG